MPMLQFPRYLILSSTILFGACALFDDSATKKPSNSGLIATPVSYYSTSRARYLGAKYKDNLDRLVERIVRNSKTANLQFANNISSVGGIGFFTHSATKTADERYLEVVLAAPETFETRGAHNDKVSRLFSAYGLDLLTILSGESDIYQDKELTGYGINIAWRNVLAAPAGNRVTLERAIVYLNKEKARSYLKREITQNDLLADATIFTVEEDGPLNLVSYRPPEVRPEFRPAIREDDLPSRGVADQPAAAMTPTITADSIRSETLPLQELVVKKSPPKPPLTVTQKPKPVAPKAPVIAVAPAKPAPPAAMIPAPVPAPMVEAAPLETAKPEVNQAATIGVAETKEATPAVKPMAKGVDTVRAAAVDLPKSAPVVPVPKGAAPAEAVKAAVIAPVPSAESPRPAALQAKPTESVAPPRLVEAPKPQPVEVKPLLSPAPAVATKVPPSEAPKVERLAPPAPIAMVEAIPAENGSVPPAAVKPAPGLPSVEASAPRSVPIESPAKSAPPVIEAPALPAQAARPKPIANVEIKSADISGSPPVAAKPVPPQPTVESPMSPPVPHIAKSDLPVIVTPAPSVATAKVETKPVEIVSAPPAAAPSAPVSPSVESIRAVPAAPIAPRAPTVIEAPARPAVAASPPPAAKAEIQPVEIVRSPPVAVQAAPSPRIAELPATLPVQPITKSAPPAVEAPVSPLVASRPPAAEKAPAKSAAEQLALLSNKPIETAPPKPAIARTAPRPLEGFIIQLAFNDKERAQRWAEAMEKKGFAVSVTEAGAEGALRVRLGNFVLRDDAERQLRAIKQEGLSGIILNLPQAFRPEARTSIP